jgi:glycosyltransferase involved in cell wall biosynthesis
MEPNAVRAAEAAPLYRHVRLSVHVAGFFCSPFAVLGVDVCVCPMSAMGQRHCIGVNGNGGDWMSAHGVSIITCSKRPECIDNLLKNYLRQRVTPKELIIVVNKDGAVKKKYEEKAKTCEDVFVYQLPAAVSLGSCLNFAVGKARYPLIAKFDDDDYYGPNYLKHCIRALRKTGADVVGKRAHFLYLQGVRTLLLRFPKAENRFVRSVAGATLVVRKRVFRKVSFPDRTVGEDVHFCRACVAKGFKIYSGERYDFVGIRRKHLKSHTWKASYRHLLSLNNAIVMPNVQSVRKFVCKTSST